MSSVWLKGLQKRTQSATLHERPWARCVQQCADLLAENLRSHKYEEASKYLSILVHRHSIYPHDVVNASMFLLDKVSATTRQANAVYEGCSWLLRTDDAKVHLTRAIRHLHEKSPNLALPYLDKLLKGDPTNAAYLFYHAVGELHLWALHGKYDTNILSSVKAKLIKCFKHQTDYDGVDMALILFLEILQYDANVSEAYTAVKEFTTSRPQYISAWLYRLHMLRAHNGDAFEQLLCIHRLTLLDPTTPVAIHALTFLHLKAPQARQFVIETLLRHVEVEPCCETPRVWLGLALALCHTHADENPVTYSTAVLDCLAKRFAPVSELQPASSFTLLESTKWWLEHYFQPEAHELRSTSSQKAMLHISRLVVAVLLEHLTRMLEVLANPSLYPESTQPPARQARLRVQKRSYREANRQRKEQKLRSTTSQSATSSSHSSSGSSSGGSSSSSSGSGSEADSEEGQEVRVSGSPARKRSTMKTEASVQRTMVSDSEEDSSDSASATSELQTTSTHINALTSSSVKDIESDEQRPDDSAQRAEEPETRVDQDCDLRFEESSQDSSDALMQQQKERDSSDEDDIDDNPPSELCTQTCNWTTNTLSTLALRHISPLRPMLKGIDSAVARGFRHSRPLLAAVTDRLVEALKPMLCQPLDLWSVENIDSAAESDFSE
eukprot:m.27018 g.27018  ORF g.27018 m.27018 type:complete len:667 (-) comp8893_c0_seq5:129-2129(-)